MTPDHYLDTVLQSMAASKVQDLVSRYKQKRTEVVEMIKKEFPRPKFLCSEPFNSGSWVKRTEVNLDFDLDIVAPFAGHHDPRKVKAAVYNFFKQKYAGQSDVMVNDQRVSTGLKFLMGSQWVSFDITSGVEKVLNGYERDVTDLILYDRIACKTIDTNVKKQIKSIEGAANEPQRRVIRLLKVWKKSHDIPLRSFELELMVMEVFAQGRVAKSQSPWVMLRDVMKYLSRSFHSLIVNDPGTGKPLTLGLNHDTRVNIAGRMKNMLAEIEKRPGAESDVLKHFFPIHSTIK